MRKERLKNIGKFYSGLSGKSKEDFSDGNALFVSYNNIFNNPVLNLDIRDTVAVGEDEKQNEVLQGDILFTGSSETPEEAGMSSVVLVEPKEKMYLNSFCFGFRLNDFNVISPAYMGHLLRSTAMRAAISKTAFGVTRFNVNKERLSNIEIPLPPLSVQQEIVSVLDSFTTLIDKMKIEVELRKKQREYYREKLLFSGGKECKLSEYAYLPKDRIKASELDENTYVSVENLLKDKKGKTLSEIVPLTGACNKFIPKDVLIGNIRPYLKKIWFSDETGGTNGDVVIIRSLEKSKLIPEYLYKVLSSDSFFTYYDGTSKGGKMPRGNKNQVLNFKFHHPLPEKQREIVRILDAFESYIQDMEKLIALRQKQYEYYREKLLTFE